MFELVPCPNQGCRGGKVHSLVGFDIFWDDCPTCDGFGAVRIRVPDDAIEHQDQKCFTSKNETGNND
ncbi:MAG: hypothetical protein LUQ04_09280 [Methanoregula sp.]|nr:hypothetical protein [Methanoregula sp.]